MKQEKRSAGNLSAFRHLRKLKCITKTIHYTIKCFILFKAFEKLSKKENYDNSVRNLAGLV